MLYIFDEMNKLDDDIPESMKSMLSDERLEKIHKLRSPLNKKVSVVAYLLLRLALLEGYCINEAVEFEYAKKGKPLLKKYPHIHFNISHSKNTAACVVSDVEVGVDVQNIAPVADAVAKRVLTSDEYNSFKSSPVPDEYFCEVWTIKESFLKKTGRGLTTKLGNLPAKEVKDRMIYKGIDYICCVCGPDMKIKHIRREDFEQLRN